MKPYLIVILLSLAAGKVHAQYYDPICFYVSSPDNKYVFKNKLVVIYDDVDKDHGRLIFQNEHTTQERTLFFTRDTALVRRLKTIKSRLLDVNPNNYIVYNTAYPYVQSMGKFIISKNDKSSTGIEYNATVVFNIDQRNAIPFYCLALDKNCYDPVVKQKKRHP